MSTGLVLKRFEVNRNPSYVSEPGSYSGEVVFDNDGSSIKIRLDAQLSSEILKLCAESMTRATKALANDITAQIINQAAAIHQIESKSLDDGVLF